MQLSVCFFSSAFAASPAHRPHSTALPTHTTISQNGLAVHSRYVNWSAPVTPAIRHDKAEHEAQSRARAGPEQDRAHDDRYQRQRDRDRPDPDAAGYGLQHDDQRGQNGQRGQTDDGCMIVAFHKYLLLSLRVFPDATQIFYHGQCPVITETKKLPGEGSAYGISSSTGSLEMGAPSLMACHCSRVMSSWRGLEPSNGPTMPRSSISSMMRAARA